MLLSNFSRTTLNALIVGLLSLGLAVSGCSDPDDDDPDPDTGVTDAGDVSDAADADDAGDTDDGGTPTIANIEISPDTAEVAVDETTTLVATAYDEDNDPIDDADLEWESDDESIATVSADNGEAEVTGVAEGSTTITVSAADDMDISASAGIEVFEPGEVDRVEISGPTQVEVGESIQLEATAFDEDDNVLTDLDATWTSADESVATVDDDGLVTGVEAERSTTITAEFDGATESVDVEVIEENTPPVADAGDDQTVAVGETVTLDATGSSDEQDDFDELAFTWHFVEDPSEGADDLQYDDTEPTATFEPSAEGVYEVQLTVIDRSGATDEDTVEITVVDEIEDEECFIISEYVEGSSNNKAVELYNCGTSELTLDDYAVCLEANTNDVTAGDTCQQEDLTGTLAADETLVLCNGEIEDDSMCDITTGTVTTFNGNDRLFIFEDTDGNGSYDHGTDTVVDAFGDIGQEPSGSPWSDVTYDRCDFTPHDGMGGFDADALYEDFPQDTFSGLGVAPTEGCP